MAGIAIVPLLNTNGLLATAMAWAAFCMPISITSVRFSFGVRCKTRDNSAPPPIAESINTVMQNHNLPNSAIIVSRCCIKNTAASNISAGNAIFERILWIFPAAEGQYRFTAIPMTMGTSIINRFCTTRLPTGSFIS